MNDGGGGSRAGRAVMGALESLETAWRARARRGGPPPSRAEEVLEFWFGRLPARRFGIRDALWLPTRVPCWGGHWASEALDNGEDALFNPLARTLFYLPLMHQEDLEMQERCLGLYERALAEAPHAAWLVLKVEHASARRHREIIARFGRFPHRNTVLGRESTPEEARFLEEPFSSF